jgi:hypothetical protein
MRLKQPFDWHKHNKPHVGASVLLYVKGSAARIGVCCLYRESPTAVSRKKEEGPNLLDRTVMGVFLMAYFVLMPIACTWVVSWAAYWLTASTFYSEPWMMPLELISGAFLGGVFIRQKIEDEMGGMGLFFLGLLALIIFSFLTHMDIAKLGGVYSQFMPRLLRPSVGDFLFMLPGIGLVGMLFYKFFTLKHYS